MSPELVIAAVSASCGVLLVVGSLMVGRATSEMVFRRKHADLHGKLKALREQLQEANTKADAARAEAEFIRMESEEKVSTALGSEMARSEKTEQEVDQLKSKLAGTEAKLAQAKAAANEADKEFTVIRDKLDKTEKRLAEATRRLVELEESAGKASAAGAPSDDRAQLERELEAAKKAASRLPVVEKERDQALQRIRELDKPPAEDPRIRTLTAKVEQLEADLRERSQKLEALQAASRTQGDVEALDQEIAQANERLAVSERVMEGVRARSNMLSQELKRVKAELAALKG